MLPGYDVSEFNPKVKVESTRRARKIDCLLCTKQFLTRIALLNHYHHVHKIRQNSLFNISRVKQSIQNIQQALANKEETTGPDFCPKTVKSSASKVSPKLQRVDTEPVKAISSLHVDSSANHVAPSMTSHRMRTAIPASMMPEGINQSSSVVYLKQTIGKTQVSSVPIENVILANENPEDILANQNAANILANQDADSIADVTELDVCNTGDVSTDDVSKTLSSNYAPLPFNESNTSMSINGLDDLLTFDSGDQDSAKIECDRVCKICFKVFSDWSNLQAHYSCIHKLNVRSHVS